MKKRIKHLFHRLFSRSGFSFFWTLLHRLSLKGLNYGYSDNPEKSGESVVLQMLQKRGPWNGEYFMLVDVGANEGQYFRFFKKFIKNYKAILFEPSVKCCTRLEALKDENVRVINKAAGQQEGILDLFFDKEGSVQGSLVQVGDKDSQQVQVTTLDNALEKDILIDLMVIDTEGFEKDVLLGAKNLVAEKRVRMIQFEHGSIHSILNQTFVKDFFEILKGYDIYHIRQNGIVKIKYSTLNEIFYNTNYLAVLKTGPIAAND